MGRYSRLMDLRYGFFALLVAAPIACGPEDNNSTSNAGASSGDTTSSPLTDDGNDVSTHGSPPPPDDTGTSTGPADSTTGPDLQCQPKDLPACVQDECVQTYEYSCDRCDFKFNDAGCFEADIECDWPRLVCDLPAPCERVWAMGEGTVEAFEDIDNAQCLLESLRDGVPGRYELMYGSMGDIGLVYIELLLGSDGALRMQLQDTCEGCPVSGFIGRSGTLELQPTEFFDECLDNPTTESLTDCLIGLSRFSPGDPPPKGWTPPFTLGTCSALEWACPPA